MKNSQNQKRTVVDNKIRSVGESIGRIISRTDKITVKELNSGKNENFDNVNKNEGDNTTKYCYFN